MDQESGRKDKIGRLTLKKSGSRDVMPEKKQGSWN
jgi:hypothetical protein